MNLQEVNELVKTVETNDVSDGYHTFGELYEHRIVNFIALSKKIADQEPHEKVPVWCTKVHSDGSIWDGWFLLGIYAERGKQITYHLPNRYYDLCCEFAREIQQAPDFDGHTSDDVLNRIINL